MSSLGGDEGLPQQHLGMSAQELGQERGPPPQGCSGKGEGPCEPGGGRVELPTKTVLRQPGWW